MREKRNKNARGPSAVTPKGLWHANNKLSGKKSEIYSDNQPRIAAPVESIGQQQQQAANVKVKFMAQR